MMSSARSSSRRDFLRGLLGAGTMAAIGAEPLVAQSPSPRLPSAGSFRFAFLTDLHLLQEGSLRSAEGIAACLSAVEKLSPRPEFILVGGDLVNAARDLLIPEAEKRFDLFLKIWRDNTSLPAYWTFGNHDLVGTSNDQVFVHDPRYGKGLFKQRLNLGRLFYSFDCQGWHFVILDDISPQPHHTYIGELFEDELAFLQADLEAHRAVPTLICTHIPVLSGLPFSLELARATGMHVTAPKNLVCTNGGRLLNDLPGHGVRAVLAGHLHRFERLEANGVSFINSGAVCGKYWTGPMLDCPEGFGVVDLSANGTVAFDYRSYGWKA